MTHLNTVIPAQAGIQATHILSFPRKRESRQYTVIPAQAGIQKTLFKLCLHSGRSAVWFSASALGAEGRWFESSRPDFNEAII